MTPPRRRCKAIKASGEQCKNAPIRGGVVCYQAHGGAAPQVKAAAARRLVLAEATSIVSQYTHVALDDPATELLTVAAEFVALKSELGRRSAELSTLTATDRHGAEQISSILGAYQSSLSQVSDVLVKINRLGLENRRTVVAERDYRALVLAIQKGTYAAGPACDPPLSHEQMRQVLDSISEAVEKAYGGA